MKQYVKSNEEVIPNIEYEDNLPDETYILDGTKNNGIVDEWGDCMAWCEDCDLGLEYNLCIDNTRGDMVDESAFYVMHRTPGSEYWDTDSDNFTPYEIDYNDPNWREKIKDFAIKLLSDIVSNR